MYILSYSTQGPAGEHGDRGESGDEGYKVLRHFQIFVFVCFFTSSMIAVETKCLLHTEKSY